MADFLALLVQIGSFALTVLLAITIMNPAIDPFIWMRLLWAWPIGIWLSCDWSWVGIIKTLHVDLADGSVRIRNILHWQWLVFNAVYVAQ